MNRLWEAGAALRLGAFWGRWLGLGRALGSGASPSAAWAWHTGLLYGFEWCRPCDGEGKVYDGTHADLKANDWSPGDGAVCTACGGRGVL